MQKAINRMWDWLFHPSVRAYSNPNSKAFIFRYPSPGNAPEDPFVTNTHEDYKTPYEHTDYNVRYKKPTAAQMRQYAAETIVAPITTNPTFKLKKVGLLKAGEENNVDAVAAAKEKFKQIYGCSVQERVYRNDANQTFLNSTNREEISAHIQSHFQSLRQAKFAETDYAMNRKVIDDPQVVPLESVDMYVTPHFQMGRISNQYMIQKSIQENKNRTFIETHVGDAKFWKAIDDSFDSHEVEKVQKQIKDPEPANFNLRSKSKIEYQLDKEGVIVDVHPKN